MIDDSTRMALRAAARLVAEGTTRAVYALFGSKEGLFVDALAQGATSERYRIAFQRVIPNLQPTPELTAARTRAWQQLLDRVHRVDTINALGDKSITEAAVEFNAMLEGLANAGLRGNLFRNLPAGREAETGATRSRRWSPASLPRASSDRPRDLARAVDASAP